MTEQKRASFITVGLSKKEKKSKADELTTRFNLTITPNNGEEFVTINYQSLISKAKSRKESKTNGVGPLDPYADDDEEQLKNLAKNFEAKYSTPEKKKSPEKKKYGRFVNYNELGAGYDENDSFIDNSEAFDEVVPEDQTTAYGGFYINVGNLEMKTIPGKSVPGGDDGSDSDGNVGGVRKASKRRLESESEEESDDDDDDEEDSSSSDMEESESEESTEEREDAKPANGQANGQVAKKAKVQNDAKAGPPLKKKKSKPSVSEKKGSDNEMPVLKREEQDSSTGGESRRPSTNSEVVDSAGGEAHNDDSGSSTSKSISGSGESSGTEDSGEASNPPKPELKVEAKPESKPPPPPPPENSNLPEDIRGLLRLIHNIVTKDPAAKLKFTSEMNKSLLRFEMKCQENPPSMRDEAYSELGVIMSCSPKKLARKASEIYIAHMQSTINTKLLSLKKAVDTQMPTCLDRYNGECKRLELSMANQDDKAKRPRRRFRWTNEMRGMVYELTNLRRTLFRLQNSSGDGTGGSEDDDVRAFLTQHVCPLWPAGWMKVVALMDVKPLSEKNSDAPAASGALSAASKPKKSLSGPRKSLPKVGNVPPSPLNPVLVPSNIQQLSVPVSSSMRTEHQPTVNTNTVNVMKKPSPPKAPTPSSLPPNIGKICVPQGTDITPVNLSSSKQNPVNGANRPSQITVKPVFNPSSQYLRDDSQCQKPKAKAQVTSDPVAVSSRTLHGKSDLHQDFDKMPVSELEIVPAASDASMAMRASPQMSKVGITSPDAHRGSWKGRPSESQSSPQWKVKDEPSTITVNPLDIQDHQANARLEEKLRNSYEEQTTSQDYRMNVMNVEKLLKADVFRQLSDILDVDRTSQSSHAPQLKAGGGASLRAD